MRIKYEDLEVMQTITVQVPGIIVRGKFWQKKVLSDKSSDYVFGVFTMRNVAEKEDEEDWWKIYGPGIEVSGNSPENVVESLTQCYDLIGDVIGKV